MKQGLILFVTIIWLTGCKPNNDVQFIESDSTSYEEFSEQLQATNVKVAGTTEGYGDLKRDGYIDFSIVFPALQRRDLLFLDTSALISPETDTVKVPFKTLDVPSNLALPKQSERYSFVGINFNKPQYRFYLSEPGNYRMVATHGRFPLKKVIDDARAGKSMFEVINHFQFIQSGSIDVAINGDLNNQNINVAQTQFDKEMSVTGPQVGNNLAVVAIALRETDGLLSPTDIKNLIPTQVQKVRTTEDNSSKFIAYLMTQKEVHILSENIYAELNISAAKRNYNQLSLALQTEAQLSEQVSFLPLVERPRRNGDLFELNAPAPTNNIAPLLTYIGLVEIEDIQKGKMKFERTTRVWEKMMPNEWANEVPYPSIDYDFRKDRRYRWIVMFAGQNPETFKAGDELNLNSITHVTRNALDL